MAVLWTVLWVAAATWSGAAIQQALHPVADADRLHLCGLGLGLCALVLLPVCGYILGRDRRWPYVGILIGYVWTLLLGLYVLAMLATPGPDGSDSDTAAGAGIAIVGVPLLFLVAALVAAGAGVSMLGGRRRGSLAP